MTRVICISNWSNLINFVDILPIRKYTCVMSYSFVERRIKITVTIFRLIVDLITFNESVDFKCNSTDTKDIECRLHAKVKFH